MFPSPTIVRNMRLFALVLLSACGAGAARPTSPADLPTLQGRPVYSAALADAPESVSGVWPEVESALAAGEPQDLDAWSRERMQLIQDLDPLWGRLAQEGVDERLFGAVTRALLYDELATTLAAGTRAADAAAEARRAYAICLREAPDASELLRDWASTCLERSAALESLRVSQQ